ncbi:MAG: ABC transporter substrate-binding protein, partial [Chloroflexi bacterium]|nr:ABC transporter substrate-binding protein [Chloroflexota bacterium]
DDWVYNIERYIKTPTSGIRAGQPRAALATVVKKTGPQELDIEITDLAEGFNGWFWLVPSMWTFHAPEVIAKYGNGLDWRNRVGDGPWIITDLVAGSVVTLKKNSNYWKKDPVGPGKDNQLPYVDTAKLLFVPDTSTKLAAMRTGKVDWIDGVEGEDARGVLTTTPRIKSYKYLPDGLGVGMRTDKKELPFSDVRVRQALMMATDFDALTNNLYKGEAEKLIWPLPPSYKESYVPLEKLPEKLQALYKYNPEKAKQLLAEAGYPNGFKTQIIVRNITSHIDPVSAIKAMWAKVGVDLEIQPRETAVYTSVYRGRTHPEMIFSSTGGTSFPVVLGMARWRGPVFSNSSYINDPPGRDSVIEAAYQNIGQYLLVDMPKADQMVRDLMPHLIEQAYMIGRPTPYSYRLWQPWVKNYYGESSIPMLITYAWLDQDLKEQTIGRR